MSDAIFITNKAGGLLKIGDKQEIDRASWRKPRGITLTRDFVTTDANGHVVRTAGCDLLEFVGDKISKKNAFRKQYVQA